MNSRIMLAFIAGLVFASGVTYYLVKPNPPAAVQSGEGESVRGHGSGRWRQIPRREAPAPAEPLPEPDR